ncbi:ABC transporter ATPase [Pedobacter alpinus]|uniref:ABC transporter ATPase n=1 Tax=Pedobacter alpinus TaxID=1590643 RepID=A0ABW5TMZ9_9SPHI
MINPGARVWIYQSDKEFEQSQLIDLDVLLKNFTANWSAHNQQLSASFEIKYNRFIVLIVDETQAGASGCSIDKSVHLMKDVEQKFNVNLFDRFNIAYKDGDKIVTVNRNSFEDLIANGKVNSFTIVFNNIVPTYEEYLNNWETPLANSWHAKLFKVEA